MRTFPIKRAFNVVSVQYVIHNVQENKTMFSYCIISVTVRCHSRLLPTFPLHCHQNFTNTAVTAHKRTTGNSGRSNNGRNLTTIALDAQSSTANQKEMHWHRNGKDAITSAAPFEHPLCKSPHLLFPRYETAPSIKKRWQECLVDRYGRFHDYLRISLTEKCNLRCQYCMPAEGVPLCPSTHLLTTEEIVRFANICSQAGLTKIRLTGGEPTLRKDFELVVKGLSSVKGISVFAMTTNGILLRRYLNILKETRLNALNISLDTLIPAKFSLMTRRNGFEKVWESIKCAIDEKFCQVKINCVVMKGFNDDELSDFVSLTETLPIHIRFIEYMPFTKNGWSDKRVCKKNEMLDIIRKDYPCLSKLPSSPNETSNMYYIPGFQGCVGFISSMSDMFCGSCNRLRLTADGNLKNCLFGIKEHFVRDLLRLSESDEEVMNILHTSLLEKAKSHGGMHFLEKQVSLNRPMIRIGG